MAVHTFAAIYIGSYEVSLKIFELASKKKLRGIDYVRRRIELGKDAYSTGSIGYELVEALCDTLSEFTRIMKEYRVDAYEAYAAAVLRDVSNEFFILDQIKLRTGLLVHVLSNSEHRFVSYKSVAMREEFEDMVKTSAAVVDVGGAGLQITLFSKGKVVTTQHLGLGTMRMRQQLARKSINLSQYELQIEEMVEKELEVFKAMYLEEGHIDHLIVIGDYMTELVRRVEKKHDEKTDDVQKFLRYLDKLGKKNLEQISEELGLANENDALIVPYMIICKCMAKGFGANSLWAPGVIVSDGIACDYAERNKIYKPTHDFDEDILSAAKSLSERYMSYSPHIDALTQMSTLIFDTMKKEHGLGKRERLLLCVAAILHDCGKYISFLNSPQCAYDIIMASEIIGLTHMEREIVANTVLYNTHPLASYQEVADKLDHDSYLVVAKLSAILRVSNAMDRSHKQKFKNVKAQLRGKELVITIETAEDIALEKTLFDAKTAYFESVFSIKPVIKEKRVYY
ncbi:MAG: HD domain-containing protein [Clostridiales bacterium]|nr:HD domain-containing protein [Roseburia sp.]MDD7636059.1 HD domain-containing protein [Clostridiales bacterium]MDY4113999.1 HD domain-containing protein [Roseburia sp.]